MAPETRARGPQLWAYHEASSFAPGHVPEAPLALDWARQPQMFRRYEGCERVLLPAVDTERLSALAADGSCAARQGARGVAPSLHALAWLLGTSSGVSQRAGDARAALLRRCAPSAGNLHPLETYVVLRAVAGLDDGVYHYDVAAHALERRALAPPSGRAPLVLVGFTLVLARAAWKYGLRALRSAVLDGGHLAAALERACAVLGWTWTPARLARRDLAHLLGVARAGEHGHAPRERPLFAASCGSDAQRCPESSELRVWRRTLSWHGRLAGPEPPFALTPALRRAWQALGVAGARSSAPRRIAPAPTPSERLHLARDVLARRSARGFGPAALKPEELLGLGQVLTAEAPRLRTLALVCDAQVLLPGLYVFGARSPLPAALGARLAWEELPACGLARLAAGDPRALLPRLVLGQTFVADAALVLVFLADFEGLEKQAGRYVDRLLAAGRCGHAAYLWATRRGLAACGLGGFDDGLLNELLGTTRTRWRVLYMLALGGPDRRG